MGGTSDVRVHLHSRHFGEKERLLVESGELAVTGFRYDSGVAALRLRNARGEVVLLPYQGQQIWDARFDERILTMRSQFQDPTPTQEYLRNYGGFLLHCGASAMGNPGSEDRHPLHGELPNAPYGSATLIVGSDALGTYAGLTGVYRHTVAFGCSYQAEPLVRLRAGSAVLHGSITFTNLQRTDMELMYLAHINFRPVDRGRLLYTAPCDPESVVVRTRLPAGLRAPEAYPSFLESLKRNPAIHNTLDPTHVYDPEVVMSLRYRGDSEGWAHSLLIHPDGYAFYVGHRPSELDHAMRWISRTPDNDAIGIALPATAEADGYTAEKAKGNLKVLPGGATVSFSFQTGLLTPEQAQEYAQRIEAIMH
ncbi:MAG: DUF4432 family protein [Spirochaetales bacterium]|nr:DUF4432 family protein [Spirochaetales bacterium]